MGHRSRRAKRRPCRRGGDRRRVAGRGRAQTGGWRLSPPTSWNDSTPSSTPTGLDPPEVSVLIESSRWLRSDRPVVGGAIVFGKRVIRRLLAWYVAPIALDQTRFNLAILRELRDLEERVAQFEGLGAPTPIGRRRTPPAGSAVRLAFVIPRFAPGVLGGAEYHVRQLAGRLLRRGHSVTVLTTCAVDHYTWRKELPPGEDLVDGIQVRRYPVTVARDRSLMARLQTALDAGFTIPAAHQEEWVRNTGHSAPLLDAIADTADRVDALVFTPTSSPAPSWGRGCAPTGA